MDWRSHRTTKQLSAKRQIEAAIRFWKAGDFDCCITLAAAAEEQCSGSGNPLLTFIKTAGAQQGITEKELVATLNETRNWLKHKTPQLDPSRQVDEREAVIMLVRAVSCFHEHYDDSSAIIDEFVGWAKEKGIPSLSRSVG